MKQKIFTLLLLIGIVFISKAQDYKDLKLYSIVDNKTLIKGTNFSFKIIFNRKVYDNIFVKFNKETSNTNYTLNKEEINISSIATNIGILNISGNVLIKRDNKTIKIIPFKQMFFVSEPNFVVINTQGNKVLKQYIEQEINISVAGVPPFKITVKTDNGEIIKKGMSFYVKPKNLGDCNLFIEAKLNPQKVIRNEFKFIVK